MQTRHASLGPPGGSLANSDDCRLLNAPQVCELTGLGKTKVYELIRKGTISVCPNRLKRPRTRSLASRVDRLARCLKANREALLTAMPHIQISIRRDNTEVEGCFTLDDGAHVTSKGPILCRVPGSIVRLLDLNQITPEVLNEKERQDIDQAILCACEQAEAVLSACSPAHSLGHCDGTTTKDTYAAFLA